MLIHFQSETISLIYYYRYLKVLILFYNFWLITSLIYIITQVLYQALKGRFHHNCLAFLIMRFAVQRPNRLK